MKQQLIAFTALTLLTACAPNPAQNRYNYNEVGQSAVVDFARVVSVKPVDITGRNTGTGALAGGTAGAVGGYQLGHGNGQVATTIGGALIGAIAGSVIEQQMANQKGYQYVVVTENKQTKTIVQYQNPDDVVFRKGDRVMLETKGTYQRLLPTDDLPDQIKRPHGIKIVD
jgi:outer membrane lipoprotein SlyB